MTSRQTSARWRCGSTHCRRGCGRFAPPGTPEAPGRFHALPVPGHAMTIPEIRANGGKYASK